MKTARRLRSWLVAGLLLLLPAVVAGAVLTVQVADLFVCSSSCGTGASPDAVLANGALALRVQLVATGTISADLQQCLETTPAVCTTNGTWNTVQTLSASGVFSQQVNPVGFWRANVATCTGCTYRYFYRYAYLVTR